MKFTQFISIFIITFFCIITIKAQDDAIRVETNLVTINVAVTDKQGKFVKGLRQEQFEIFDNNAKQQISHFSSENAPVSYGIVYDMHPTTDERTKAVLESLRAFTKELPEADDFFVLSFNMRGALKTDFVPTVEQIEKQVDSREPNSLYDAIYAAADKLRTSRNLKRTLLVISDSADHNSRYSFSDLSKELKTLDMQIYAVIFDEAEMWAYSDITQGGERRKRISGDANQLDRAAMQELTLKSGGTSNFPTTASGQELYRIYNKVASELREFYTLSFYPADAADGKWHELKIGLRSVKGSKQFALTYRQGYQSPLLKR